MTPEERELQRALDSRSGEVTPEFRARLSSMLSAEGRPSSNFLPALAAVAAVVLVFVTVGVLLLARQARNEPPPVTAATPTTGPTPTPSGLPTPSPTPIVEIGVLIKPPHPIALPANAELSAPSTNVVWAMMSNEFLYRSTDRGKTWEQRPTLGVFFGAVGQLEMSFASAQEGWVTEGGPRPGSRGPCDIYLTSVWHTADAGASWHSLPDTGIPDSRCSSGLSFVDSSRGFIGAWDQSHPPVIYRTLDGGRTWSASKPLPTPPGYKTVCVGCIGMQTGPVRAFGSTLLVSAGVAYNQYVFRSTDGGVTWSYLAKAPVQDSNVDFVTATRWLQLIAPGQSYETTDAGATWHMSASQYSQAAPIGADFVFADSQVGYATVRGEISRTVDSGLQWVRLHSPGT